MDKNIEDIILKKLISGANTATSVMKSTLVTRIFSVGNDSKGNMLTPYSRSYIPIRERAGLQVAYKDLVFSGALRASMITNGIRIQAGVIKAGIVVTNSEQVAKMSYIEKQERKLIFTPSNSELNKVSNILKRWIQF